MQKLSICLLSFILIFAAAGPLLSGYSYDETHLSLKNQPPSFTHWFGTDDLGRDLFTRTCYGARISLLIGLAAAFIDLAIGVFWGGLAAYFGNRIDEFMMRFADVLYACPYLLCVIVLMTFLGTGLLTLLIAMTLLGWVTMARIVRGTVLQIKEQDYILAAKSIGASPLRIVLKHILPNAMGPIIATVTLTIPSVIFTEAFLSFLGLGIQAPIASWGSMANEGLPALKYYPWRLFFPALFISLTMLAFNVIGDDLQKRYDPIKH